MNKLIVGIFIFDGVDALDLAGPFEVFSRTRSTPGVESRQSEEAAPFQVVTVAQTTAAVLAGGGLTILPRLHDFAMKLSGDCFSIISLRHNIPKVTRPENLGTVPGRFSGKQRVNCLH